VNGESDIPPAFRDDDIDHIRTIIRTARLANLVTVASEGPVATPLPLFVDETEGDCGVLYGHLAKAIANGWSAFWPGAEATPVRHVHRL
jgi:predicted FMN-binding regulatory protein PaiB